MDNSFNTCRCWYCKGVGGYLCRRCICYNNSRCGRTIHLLRRHRGRACERVCLSHNWCWHERVPLSKTWCWCLFGRRSVRWRCRCRCLCRHPRQRRGGTCACCDGCAGRDACFQSSHGRAPTSWRHWDFRKTRKRPTPAASVCTWWFAPSSARAVSRRGLC